MKKFKVDGVTFFEISIGGFTLIDICPNSLLGRIAGMGFSLN